MGGSHHKPQVKLEGKHGSLGDRRLPLVTTVVLEYVDGTDLKNSQDILSEVMVHNHHTGGCALMLKPLQLDVSQESGSSSKALSIHSQRMMDGKKSQRFGGR